MLRLRVQPVPDHAFDWRSGAVRFRVGRAATCELRFEGAAAKFVSSEHVEFEVGPAGLAVTDLGSTNGVFIEDFRIQGRTPLRVGSQIRLGRTGPLLEVVDYAAPAELSPAAGFEVSARSPDGSSYAGPSAGAPLGYPAAVPTGLPTGSPTGLPLQPMSPQFMQPQSAFPQPLHWQQMLPQGIASQPIPFQGAPSAMEPPGSTIDDDLPVDRPRRGRRRRSGDSRPGLGTYNIVVLAVGSIGLAAVLWLRANHWKIQLISEDQIAEESQPAAQVDPHPNSHGHALVGQAPAAKPAHHRAAPHDE